MREARLGVDVGGTFTDLVALGKEGGVLTAKVPSTPRDQSEGVMASIRAAGIAPEDVAAFAHGMTVATNALLERRGARTALVTTEGFRDVLEIARQNRPALYDLTRDRPPALVPRELRFTVRERMGPDGEVEPLDEGSLKKVVAALRQAEVEAVAVCLLFAFLYPEHERRVGEALREALPEVHVSLSSEVLPEFREYERFSTTAADAYLAPRLAAYLGNLGRKVEAADVPAPLVMQSSGGVREIEAAARGAANFVLSGPAGGVVGAAYVCGASGYGDVLTFDMGGTSTDVAPIVGGEVVTTTEAEVAGVPIKLPTVDVHTVSAGGGSVAWADAGGALRVGPHSAGAEPGPAAYGKGGEEPTVTDANLFLGYLRDGAKLGGEVVLDRGLSEKALASVGARLGMDPLEVALGVVEVANTEMVGALRVISVERGLDPREFALVAFGGAGGLHACALAEELGVGTVLVPRTSGVLSALGLAISDVRRDYVRPFLSLLEDVEAGELERAFESLEARAAKDLDGPEFGRRADLRYARQSFELIVDADLPGALAERFHAAHERRYGYRMESEPVELVNLRLTATVPVEKPDLYEPEPEGDAGAGRREANFGGGWTDVPVFDRGRMGRSSEVEGPAVVEFAEATCVVRPGWRGAVDGVGTLVLRRSDV
ncbi:N-methylhydantoinase A/acetone carboxylase beta subunit [Rubrobacter radiotolerans]|uniref:Hydantoinase/oxoprolinase family protein n=1 Tax=Rubrobacter radiotolerans TaxID=42256 RepID=A0A023X6S3_RUBRA|nr:hydantoinase/oxoprolinase family protein [Rubrobacter radiotolerans]AHY47769.1 N-methylhydantoinase A/acetone carboxylase beta subunit [Rubrobacter radiotolerans]MDX5892408.1 hydantoinase/oxoprolinase family protein [Rubrobacter radiotolerans]SMC07699.1 N-methylhydantoinase A [Rubrobacter radiotolerans DSM 5868]